VSVTKNNKLSLEKLIKQNPSKDNKKNNNSSKSIEKSIIEKINE
jgi:hypothetical protein